MERRRPAFFYPMSKHRIRNEPNRRAVRSLAIGVEG